MIKAGQRWIRKDVGTLTIFEVSEHWVKYTWSHWEHNENGLTPIHEFDKDMMEKELRREGDTLHEPSLISEILERYE